MVVVVAPSPSATRCRRLRRRVADGRALACALLTLAAAVTLLQQSRRGAHLVVVVVAPRHQLHIAVADVAVSLMAARLPARC